MAGVSSYISCRTNHSKIYWCKGNTAGDKVIQIHNTVVPKGNVKQYNSEIIVLKAVISKRCKYASTEVRRHQPFLFSKWLSNVCTNSNTTHSTSVN